MSRRSRAVVPLLALLAPCLACASSGKASAKDGESERYVQRVAGSTDKHTGLILTELDGTLRIWSNLTATGDPDRDRNRAAALQEELRYRSRKHFDLLVRELEAGPTRNRMIAAMALGFSNAPEALTKLVAALDDPDDRVEINALIGLSVLASQDTPLDLLTQRMTEHPDPQARAMAASALSYCLQSGATGSRVVESARIGLIDEEPVVRMKAALILAELHDGESVPAIAELLEDDVPIVQRAARYALSFLGLNVESARGDAARALTAALSRAEDKSERRQLILYLQKLSSINHGDDVEAWVTWSHQIL